MDFRDWVRSEREEFRALFERTVLRLIPREQLSVRPGGTGNSIVWLMWHLARVEDVAIHVIVRGQPQVLGTWLERLKVTEYRVGTGFSEEEVEELSRSIDVEAVDGYWQAVRQATDEWFSAVSPDELDAVPDVDARLKAIPEIVGEQSSWLLDFWRGRRAAFFLRLPAINHGYLHLGQMQEIRGRLGITGR